MFTSVPCIPIEIRFLSTAAASTNHSRANAPVMRGLGASVDEMTSVRPRGSRRSVMFAEAKAKLGTAGCGTSPVVENLRTGARRPEWARRTVTLVASAYFYTMGRQGETLCEETSATRPRPDLRLLAARGDGMLG